MRMKDAQMAENWIVPLTISRIYFGMNRIVVKRRVETIGK